MIESYYRWWCEKQSIETEVIDNGITVLREAMKCADVTPWVVVDDDGNIQGVLFVVCAIQNNEPIAELKIPAYVGDKYQFASTLENFYQGIGLTFRIGG